MKQSSLAIRLEGRLERLDALGHAAAQLEQCLAAGPPDGERLKSLMVQMDQLAGSEPEFLEACAAFERYRETAVSRDLATFQRARRQWTQLHDEIRRLVPPALRTSLAGDWTHLSARLPRYVVLKRELADFTRRSLTLTHGAKRFVLWGGWSLFSKPRLCRPCEEARAAPRQEFDTGCPGCGRTTRSIAAEIDQVLGWPAMR